MIPESHGKRSRTRLVRFLVIGALAIPASGCGGIQESGRVDPGEQPPSIAAVLQEHAPRLMKIEGVEGAYESRTEDGRPCIKVMVVEDTPELRAKIPEAIEGYPVLLRPTGELGPRSDG